MKTSTWQFSMCPAVPLYWRATPARVLALPREPGLVDGPHSGLVRQTVDDIGQQGVPARVW